MTHVNIVLNCARLTAPAILREFLRSSLHLHSNKVEPELTNLYLLVAIVQRYFSGHTRHLSYRDQQPY